MLFEQIKIKLKEKDYKKYIYEHRAAIADAFTEMVMCEELHYLWENEEFYNKMVDRITEHDMSKFSKEEFDAYRKYYHPINEQEKEAAAQEFELAWEHHKKVNDHHWQHRKDFLDFTENTQLAILENVCDWLAMGYVFGNRPYEYYEQHKDNISLPEKDRTFLEMVIYALEKDIKSETYNYGKRK